ncbi:MAG TPA: SPOR domain-containing protein [Polyangiaceae bacterium]|jgi:cell division septation protein DedD
MDPGSVRNLERIQEKDDQTRMPRGVSIVLLVLGGACVVLAAMALGGKKSSDAAARVDPLGDLVAQKGKPVAPKTDLAAQDVTFPSILSDQNKPTTALAALGAQPQASAASSLAMPPPPTDVLPVVPLPAQNVLQASPVVTRPRDELTRAASEVEASAEAKTASPSGHEGGYQLQVSSFKTEQEASAFAQQLRVRGHKAYVVTANVPGRGTWYRVRVGPFPTQAAATSYRSSFEAKEHVVPFVVPPSSQSQR